MRLGATLTHLSPGPPVAIAEWAKRLVGAGFESLWTPQIIGRGYLVPDPFATLAVAATATEEVELGTATLQVPLHHPADLAHRMLSLLSVCGDRLSLGVSPGSTEDDYAAFDRDYPGRFRTFRQNLSRVRLLLAQGGDDRADLAPAPATVPPILLGSWGRTSSGPPASSTAGWPRTTVARPMRSSPPTNATELPAVDGQLSVPSDWRVPMISGPPE